MLFTVALKVLNIEEKSDMFVVAGGWRERGDVVRSGVICFVGFEREREKVSKN